MKADTLAPAALSPFEIVTLRHAVAHGVYVSAEFLALQMIERGLLRDDGIEPAACVQAAPGDAERLQRLKPKARAAAQAARELAAVRVECHRLAATDAGRAALAAHDAQAAAQAAAAPSLQDEITALVSRIVFVPRTADELRAHEFKTMIEPRLRGAGFGAEHRRDLGVWNCEPQQKTFEAALQALRTPGAIVALIGKRGTGKTMIAAQIAAQWAREDIASGLRGGGATYRYTPYVKLTDLLARFKALFADFGTKDPEALAAARDYFFSRNELITIDEIGECEELGTRQRLITDSIDRIYSARQRAILISNQTAEEFEIGIGKSAHSRLTQYGVIFRCNWQSFRDRQ